MDEKTERDLHYALYLRRFYLQLHPVEWHMVDVVITRIDRILDRYNEARQEQAA